MRSLLLVVVFGLIGASGFVLAQDQATPTIEPQSIIATVWSPDGSKIALSGSNGLFQIRNQLGEVLINLTSLATTTVAVDWSPDSTKVVTGSDDGLLRVWNVSTGQQEATLTGFNSYVQLVDWSPDGLKILATGYSSPNTVIIWNATTYQQINGLVVGDVFGAA